MSDESADFKKLEVPKFESTIPVHLLEGSTAQERYILDSLSVNAQQNSWLIDSLVVESRGLHSLNKRVTTVETWKSKLTSYKATAVYIALFVLGAINTAPSVYYVARLLDNKVEGSVVIQTQPSDPNLYAQVIRPSASPKTRALPVTSSGSP
jgi:hypothetical protein